MSLSAKNSLFNYGREKRPKKSPFIQKKGMLINSLGSWLQRLEVPLEGPRPGGRTTSVKGFSFRLTITKKLPYRVGHKKPDGTLGTSRDPPRGREERWGQKTFQIQLRGGRTHFKKKREKRKKKRILINRKRVLFREEKPRGMARRR